MPIFFLPSWWYPVFVHVDAANGFIIAYLPGKHILQKPGFTERVSGIEELT
jgi:hypothetical protein